MRVVSIGQRVRVGARGLARDAVVFGAAFAITNILNYAYHMVMTRMLGPSTYGALGSLLALVLIFTVPTSALQAVIARRFALLDDPAARSGLIRNATRCTLIAAATLGAFLLVASPAAANLLHVATTAPVALLPVLLVVMAVAPVGRGVLHGSRRFGALGAALVVAAACKLIVGSLLVRAGFDLVGAIGGMLIGELAGVALMYALLRRDVAVKPAPVAMRPVLTEAGRAIVALIAFWILVGVDVIIVRHFQPGEVSGRYAAAALLGRVVLFLPAAITVVLFPRFASDPYSDRSLRLLKLGVACVGGLGLAASLAIVALPDLVVKLFGSAYLGAGAVGEVLALAMTGFGMLSVLLSYRLACNRPPVKTLWAAVVIEVVAIVLQRGDPLRTAFTLLGMGAFIVTWLAAQALRRMKATQAAGPLWTGSGGDTDLSVVVPCYNGAAYVRSNLERLAQTLTTSRIRHEIILVSDGSTDGSERVASACVDGLRILHYERNQGKGFALRAGLAQASGRYVAFIDADGDLDPAELGRFMQMMELYGADLVIGSKRHPLSDVHYPAFRRVMSWGYHKLVRVLFGIKVSDSQTGLKLVKREVLVTVLPRLVEKRFAFDLELLVAARRAGYRRIMEAPVALTYRFASTVSWRAVRGIVLDTAAIWYRRFVLGWYDPDTVVRSVTIDLASPPVPAATD